MGIGNNTRMSAFILRDRYFDPEAGRISSYFCQLFVLIGQDSLQYCILDSEKNSFIALADYRLPSFPKTPEILYEQLGQLISEEEILRKKYPSVVVGIDTPWHTLVPSPLFDPVQVNKYLEFNFSLPQGLNFRSDRVEEIDAYNIYGILPVSVDLIHTYFKAAAIVHRSTALIKAIYQYNRAIPNPLRVFIHVRDQYIDLVAYDGNRPAFFNSFPCQSREDILYFTIYSIEQLKLRPDSVQLYISGMLDAGSDTYRLLEQYFLSVAFTGRLSTYHYSPFFDQLPAHRYQELFALALCGS
jgi:hypothetical protein